MTSQNHNSHMSPVEKTADLTQIKPRPKCGIVMPISASDGCAENHWQDVKQIIMDALENTGFECDLVSASDESGVIQKRIIQNLHDNEIVVCDVSCKNPNVMFELGMRLAFDKPTIIIKDNSTSFTFDVQVVEHLVYPRDLRFGAIVEFKKKLAARVLATVERAKDPNYTTFLKHFGEFTVAKLSTREVSKDEYLVTAVEQLRTTVDSLSTEFRRTQSALRREIPNFGQLRGGDLLEISRKVEATIDDAIGRAHAAFLLDATADNLEARIESALISVRNELPKLGIHSVDDDHLRDRIRNYHQRLYRPTR